MFLLRHFIGARGREVSVLSKDGIVLVLRELTAVWHGTMPVATILSCSGETHSLSLCPNRSSGDRKGSSPVGMQAPGPAVSKMSLFSFFLLEVHPVPFLSRPSNSACDSHTSRHQLPRDLAHVNSTPQRGSLEGKNFVPTWPCYFVSQGEKKTVVI